MKNRKKIIFTVVTACLAAGCIAGAAEKNPWRLARNRKGIKIYTRKVEGIAFKQFKGTVVIDAPLSSLIAAFEDLEAASQWVKDCEKMELVERVSPTESYVYSYSPAPWPVKDRDAVVFNTITQDPDTLVVTILQTAAPDKKEEHKKAVRIQRIDGLWTLTPMADGKTQLVYQVLSDPGGGLPAWLVNMVSVSLPYDVLNGMRATARDDKYKKAQFDFIQNPPPES